MSDTYNWAFGARDAAKAEIRVAVRYLLKGANRDVVALEIMEIMRQAGLPAKPRA